MTKNRFKLKKTTNLPFFGTVKKRDSLFTTIPFLKNFFKPSIFFSNYRIRAKTSITTNWKQLNNIQFIIALFPFVFSFSLLIRSRYKGQLFSYLVKDNLPGFCLPHQNLSWETFREITSKKIASLSDDKLYICKSPNTWTDKSEVINNSFGSQIEDSSVEMLEDNDQMLDSTLDKSEVINNSFGSQIEDSSVEMLEDNDQMLDSTLDKPVTKMEFSSQVSLKFNSFVSKEQRKQTNLQNQDLIERLDIYGNLIILEMKPVWEYKQKQFYTGFLPKVNKITLNKLPVFFNGKQKVAEKTFASISNKEESFGSAKKLPQEQSSCLGLQIEDETKNIFFGFGAGPKNTLQKQSLKQKMQTKNAKHFLSGTFCQCLPLQTKNNKSEKFFEYKFSARKPNFLSFSKNKIDLKPTLINKKPNLINVFTKQPFQQKLFDLDELPLKLEQNYSEALPLKKQENQKYFPIPGPNIFEAFQSFPNHKFFSDFSSNKEKNISNVENCIANLDKPIPKTEFSSQVSLKFDSNLLSETKQHTNETLLAAGKPGQTDNKNEVFVSDLLEIYQSDVKEEIFYKKSFLENELKKFFYNEGFIPSVNKNTIFVKAMLKKGPFKNLQKHTNQFTYLDLTTSFTTRGSRRFANFVSDFSNKEKNINDVKEFEFFDYIQNVILNLEKDNINLTLPEQSSVTKLRLLSGYLYPDMEIAKIRLLFIQNIYKNIIFERLNKKSFPIKIEIPSSFVDDLLNESNSLMSTSTQNLTKNAKHFLPVSQVFVSLLKEKKPIFNFLPNLQLNFHYLPASQTLLNQNLTENSNVGGIYQKVLTIYKADRTIQSSLTKNPDRNLQFIKAKNFSVLSSNKNDVNVSSNNPNNLLLFLKPFLYLQTPFRESWEPVTVQSWSRLQISELFAGQLFPFGKSWFAITKLSFVFIALKIFQSLLSIYGKELAFLGFFDDNLKEEFGLTDDKKDKGYRLIKKVKKRFKDVVGIDNILPELGEIVWILRNSGPTFKVGHFLPKGFLFVGPPGTGKTLLVQAIAGEAEVPVLVQSGSSLTSSEENEEGAQRLRNLFEQARKVAPCIVFIDEIDTLGESRQDVMSTSVGTDDLIQSLHQSNRGSTETSSNNSINGNKAGNIAEKQSSNTDTRLDFFVSGDLTRNANIEKTSVGKKNQAKQQTNQEQLNLLMQFLIELDGLKSRTGVIVIGATNRPKVLDPALTRPGRFDRVLNLELPGRKKRIEILKFYSRNLGLTLSSSKKIEEKINGRTNLGFLLESLESKIGTLLINENKQTNTSTDFPVTINNNLKEKKDRNNVLKNKNQDLDFSWEYLANRTFGFSTAALATAMNESSLRAILRDTGHTVETIDRGIEVITSYSIEKPKIDNEKGFLLKTTKTPFETKKAKRVSVLEKDPFFITRFAYYQAGKAVLHTLLPEHPDAMILKLWPQPKNSRYKESNLPLTSNNNRAKLETRLIGLYAGKAAELLALSLHSHIKEENTNKKKRTDKIKAKTLNKLQTNFDKPVTKTKFLSQVCLKFVKVGQETKSTNKQTKKLSFSKVNNLTKQNFYQSDKRNLWHSNLGIEDLSAASHLAHSLVDKWHFYSNKMAIRRENQIFTNQNQFETSEIEVFELFQQLTEDLQNRISASNISESRLRKERDKYSRYNFQEWSIRPWWQDQITKQTGFSLENSKNDVSVRNLNMFYDDWYRIYLPDPEESERNEEWVTPDEYYHNTQNLKNLLPKKRYNQTKNTFKQTLNKPLTKNALHFLSGSVSLWGRGPKEAKVCQGLSGFDITWNDIYKLDRDYIYHALILTSFNQAFSLLDENRELLDYLADYLMRFETLRQQEIKEIFDDFGSPNIEKKSFFKKKPTETKTRFLSLFVPNEATFATDKQKVKILFDKKWGKNSRRNFYRFFSFDQQALTKTKFLFPLSKNKNYRPFTFFETINK